jgi:ribosomal protein S14
MNSKKPPPDEPEAQYSLSDLVSFAKDCIAAERYPNDYHTFTPFKCRHCGVVPMELSIEHHRGSKKGNFKGLITGRCANCGSEDSLFSFTGAGREPLRLKKPVCKCGGTEFFAANCERIEGAKGLPGFFDEGVIVGQCSRCGRNHAFVYTD